MSFLDPATSQAIGSVANPTLGALGVYSNLQRGDPTGYARAVSGGIKTVGQLQQLLNGKNTLGALNQVAGGLNNVANIYGGIQQGGLQGYGSAAANAAQLGGHLLGNQALSTAGGYVAAPLALYNAVKNWESGATGSDALGGMSAGASIGSIVPGVGTLIGGLVGGAVGALSSAFGPGKESESHKVWEQYKTQVPPGTSGSQVPTEPFEEALLGAWQSNQKALDTFTKMDTSGMTHPNSKHGGDAEGFKGWMVNSLADGLSTGAIQPGMSSDQVFQNYVAPQMDKYWKDTGSKMNMSTWQKQYPDMVNMVKQLTDRAMSGQQIDRHSENYRGQAGSYQDIPSLSEAMQRKQTAGGGALQRATTPPPTDYYHYGESGPEHMFFQSGPAAQAPAPAAPPTSQKQVPPTPTQPRAVMARGGALAQANAAQLPSHEAYVGSRTPSSGRADDIDAKLANNEYVMDAETVSLLGDGSPDEGARRLDELRAKIRAHKGKALAKGKFSPNAKKPENYLAGGR